jgi:hypothetical protein
VTPERAGGPVATAAVDMLFGDLRAGDAWHRGTTSGFATSGKVTDATRQDQFGDRLVAVDVARSTYSAGRTANGVASNLLPRQEGRAWLVGSSQCSLQ